MSQVLVVDADPSTVALFATILRKAGYSVFTAATGNEALACLRQHPSIDLTIADLRLPDISGLDILKTIRGSAFPTSVVIVTGLGSTRDAVIAMRLGAVDFREKPLYEEELIRTVQTALMLAHEHDLSPHREAHAASRWAQLVVRIMESPSDLRTTLRWGRWLAMSPGAVRNWCRTAGAQPRRTLVLGRLLRAVHLREQEHKRLEDLLDVVDRRTLISLMKFAGFSSIEDFPADIHDFLERQVLVREQSLLFELQRQLGLRFGPSSAASGPESKNVDTRH